MIILFDSCKEEKRVIEKIDFKPKYKFSSEIENDVEKDTVSWKYQISASNYALKGDYKNALIQWDLAMGTREKNFSKSQIDSINQKYSKIKASEYIIEKAKEGKTGTQFLLRLPWLWYRTILSNSGLLSICLKDNMVAGIPVPASGIF